MIIKGVREYEITTEQFLSKLKKLAIRSNENGLYYFVWKFIRKKTINIIIWNIFIYGHVDKNIYIYRNT